MSQPDTDLQLSIETSIDPVEQTIRQRLRTEQGTIIESIVCLREQQVRQALIALGWTPPGENK